MILTCFRELRLLSMLIYNDKGIYPLAVPLLDSSHSRPPLTRVSVIHITFRAVVRPREDAHVQSDAVGVKGLVNQF